MAKANPKRKEPFDIFGDERLSAAMHAATSDPPAPARTAKTAEEAETRSGDQPTGGDESAREQETKSPPLGSSEKAPDASEEARPVPGRQLTKRAEAAGEKRTRPARARSPASSAPEPHVPLKFEVPRSMRAEFQAFRAELGSALGGVALDNSNIGRALLARLLGPDRARVLEAARRSGGALRRPRNDDLDAMEAFDAALREVFERAD